MKDKFYTTTARFYTDEGKFIVADSCEWAIRGNALRDAREWLDEVEDLLPTNISVRGHDGRFVKWKH